MVCQGGPFSQPHLDLRAMGPAKRVVIVDDHPVLRDGLTFLLNPEEDIEICAQAGSAKEALDAVNATHPDLVVTDLTLPDRNGIELIKDLKALHPKIYVLVVSMHDELLYAERVLRAGGRGYVMKESTSQFLVEAIRCVAQGKIYVSDAVTAHFLDSLSGGQAGGSLSFPLNRLTDRELEIFERIGHGKGLDEIASALGISVRTVDAHRSQIRKKLRIADSNELLRFAVRWVESGEAV